jgi:hypothetical protein
MTEVSDVGLTIADRKPIRQRIGKLFLVAMSIGLLALVVLSFSRTFFLRALFDQPDMPAYLFAHGTVLTTWYVWLVLQSSLVVSGRTDLHRRLGIIGVAVAICVVVVSLITLLQFPGRIRAYGADIGEGAATFAMFTISSAFDVLKFTVLVTLAVFYRRRSVLHKRLMLFASIAIIGAVFSRLPDSLLALGVVPGIIPVVTPVILVLLIIGPIAYDVIVRGRPHVATIVFTIVQASGAAAAPMLAANPTIRGALGIG